MDDYCLREGVARAGGRPKVGVGCCSGERRLGVASLVLLSFGRWRVRCVSSDRLRAVAWIGFVRWSGALALGSASRQVGPGRKYERRGGRAKHNCVALRVRAGENNKSVKAG